MNPAAARGRDWTLPTALFLVVLLLTIAAYRQTVASLLHVWATSDTFAHGFLVVPISGYLIWLKRRALASLDPRPYPLAMLLAPVLGVAWLAGRATSTALVEQVTLVAFIPVLVCAFFGLRVTRLLAFPLGFLFFAVPFGDVFQPTLMEFTADITVRALRWSGVPVVREGLFLTTPIAQWRVAEACSGLNYLVSGFALACIFSYLTFRAAWKRLACAGLSIVVLILANGFRAYALVLVGYLSEMRLGVGFDHYAFGWVVYVIVLVAFFAVGSRFRDPVTLEREARVHAAAAGKGARVEGTIPWFGVASLALLGVGIWPPLYSYVTPSGPNSQAAPVTPPKPTGGWVLAPDLPPDWKPAFTGAASETSRVYRNDSTSVACYIAVYEHLGGEREMIQHGNAILDPRDRSWRHSGERDRRVDVHGRTLAVRETEIRGPDGRYLVWHWYWFPDEFTSSPGWGKVLQARAALFLRRDDAAVIVLHAPVGDPRDAARSLDRFVQEMLPSIRSSLHRVDSGH